MSMIDCFPMLLRWKWLLGCQDYCSEKIVKWLGFRLEWILIGTQPPNLVSSKNCLYFLISLLSPLVLCDFSLCRTSINTLQYCQKILLVIREFLIYTWKIQEQVQVCRYLP